MQLKTRTDPEQPCPGRLCLCARSLGHIKDYNSGHICLVLGEDCPQLAVGSSGHERNIRKKGSRNLQLTEKVYS